MQNRNILQCDYTLNEKSYQLKIPMDVDCIIPKDDCVRLLSQFVEELDLTDLYQTYSRSTRGNQVTPRQMLKIVLYAYLEGFYSCRDMETACKRDINFMYLLEGKPAPDHATFARFRQLHFVPCAKRLMAKMTEFLYGTGELSGREIFIDGTKIEAYANRYTFVWKKATTRNQEKLYEKIAATVESCICAYELKPLWQGIVKPEHLEQLLKRLLVIKEEENIAFVHGKGTRKTSLQRYIEDIEAYLDKLKEYAQKLQICGDRNSYSKTDHDATFMRMKEDHMRNGQLKPAYNLQHGVDSSYVVWLSVSPNPTDVRTLKPFMEEMGANLAFSYRTVVADAGYESEENYSYLEEQGQIAVIKPANYEISKKRTFKKDIWRAENMNYNPDGDFYTCKAGKRLYAKGVKREKSKSGYVRKVTCYECTGCKGCSFKQACIKGNNSKTPFEDRVKRIQVSRKFVRQRAEALKRITSPEGCKLRMNRSIYAEGSFAQLKHDRGFKRYMCRGKTNVYAESVLLAMSQNIGRLHSRIQSGKTGIHLYELKETA